MAAQHRCRPRPRWASHRSWGDARANASTRSRCKRRSRCSVEEAESESPFLVDLVFIGLGEHDVLTEVPAQKKAPCQVEAGADAVVPHLIGAIHRCGQGSLG